MDLPEFLLARIVEDEELAREATDDGHRWLVQDETIGLWPDREDDDFISFPRKAHAFHAATWNPERVLAECHAKRRIVEASQRAEAADQSELAFGALRRAYRDGAAALQGALYALAEVYADHPDYDPAWRDAA